MYSNETLLLLGWHARKLAEKTRARKLPNPIRDCGAEYRRRH